MKDKLNIHAGDDTVEVVNTSGGQCNIASGNATISVTNNSSVNVSCNTQTTFRPDPDKLKRRIVLIEKRLNSDNLSAEDRYDFEKLLDETKEELYACQQ